MVHGKEEVRRGGERCGGLSDWIDSIALKFQLEIFKNYDKL